MLPNLGRHVSRFVSMLTDGMSRGRGSGVSCAKKRRRRWTRATHIGKKSTMAYGLALVSQRLGSGADDGGAISTCAGGVGSDGPIEVGAGCAPVGRWHGAVRKSGPVGSLQRMVTGGAHLAAMLGRAAVPNASMANATSRTSCRSRGRICPAPSLVRRLCWDRALAVCGATP